jgi:hypothetical protein
MRAAKKIRAKGDDVKMNRKANIFGRGFFAALAISMIFAASASANPAWNFEGKSLEGSEVVVGAAFESSMTIPGLTTKCENFLYKLTIKNEAGTGKGELTEMPLYNCTTNSAACTVKTIGAETLPWPAHLTKIEPSNYIVIEKAKVGIVYAGEECALKGVSVKVTGSAGGLLDNVAETATFNSSTLKTTKTELKALGSAIEWNGVFPTEAFQWHRNQPLTVS